VKIDDFVPIMIDTDGNPVSGWTEGLHDQDLQPVGLIKFDVLAIKDLLRIAHCCKLIKERHPEIKSISALEGCSDWSDISYLNDPKSISLANESKTRAIFQFDSEGMRNLVKSGGVDNFNDLVTYTALFRPSALKMGMHERYIQRKKGKEQWEDQVPDCIREVLKKTHGILAFQEQCMQVLNIVGDIPLIHCEKIRKAISKKKIEEFAKYKQMFLENGSKKTGWPIDSEDNRNMNYL
jgi:DNA polymerase-3 subunit alpha